MSSWQQFFYRRGAGNRRKFLFFFLGDSLRSSQRLSGKILRQFRIRRLRLLRLYSRQHRAGARFDAEFRVNMLDVLMNRSQADAAQD